MSNYEVLSKDLSLLMQKEKQNNTYKKVACDEQKVIRRRDNPHDDATVWRTAFVRDVDKIINCPYYNHYTDKTQVFSLRKNDDIAHRSLHVQLVSRIARTIGKALNLNVDLIEAISLGHDIGHTPFGHTGEDFLDKLYRQKTSLRFSHNIHSVRVLDKIFALNISLQTLDGISAHNGELELEKYSPIPLNSFEEFDKKIQDCYTDRSAILKLTPSTLEGCVMRISDIIAYLGKDRHDAEKYNPDIKFTDYGIGTINAEIVNNLIVNVIENSYGKDYIKMDKLHFDALKKCKKDNYDNIYKNNETSKDDQVLFAMMEQIYNKLLLDLNNGVKSSPIFTKHIDFLNAPYYAKNREKPYEQTESNLIVVDYIASMTDDYFIELYKYLFPKSSLNVKYKGYFE